MKSFVCVCIAGAALAGTALMPATANENTMAGYYENTLVSFVTNMFENRTWYNKDGSAVHFNAEWKNGQIALDAYDEKWVLDDGYVPRVTPVGADGKKGLSVMEHNHFPGQTWRMLQPDGPYQDMRIVYTIMPGHQ